MKKIAVFIKVVPDTNSRIQLKGDVVDQSEFKWVINPYDEFALEEAIKTKEAWAKNNQPAEVVAILLGPKTQQKSLRDALAIGADRAIHILDDQGLASDPKSVSKALAAMAKEEGISLIYCGKQAIDDDAHATGAMVAERLQWPHVAVVSKCEWTGPETLKVERDVEGGVKEIFEVTLPALITATKGLNKVRLASLIGIRNAAKKELKEIPLSAEFKSTMKVSQWTLPPERGDVKWIEGDAATQAKELVRRLREEAKAI